MELKFFSRENCLLRGPNFEYRECMVVNGERGKKREREREREREYRGFSWIECPRSSLEVSERNGRIERERDCVNVRKVYGPRQKFEAKYYICFKIYFNVNINIE